MIEAIKGFRCTLYDAGNTHATCKSTDEIVGELFLCGSSDANCSHKQYCEIHTFDKDEPVSEEIRGGN